MLNPMFKKMVGVMLEQLLAREEGKTLEFKENSGPLHRIVQTVIAFANTAGGVILLGVKDGSKEVVGLDNILEDELKIAHLDCNASNK